MAGWLRKALKRIRELAAEGRFGLTYKALSEAESLGLAPEDVQDVLTRLGASDSEGRVISTTTGEWMYLFRPQVGAQVFYVKLILRDGCVVVSFHHDEDGIHEDEEESG